MLNIPIGSRLPIWEFDTKSGTFEKLLLSVSFQEASQNGTETNLLSTDTIRLNRNQKHRPKRDNAYRQDIPRDSKKAGHPTFAHNFAIC